MFRTLLSAAIALLALLLPAAAPAQNLSVYEDSLETQWQSWSWDTSVNTSSTAEAHTGARSIRVQTTSAWGAFYLRSNVTIDESIYSDLRFYIHGGSSGGQEYNVALIDGSGNIAPNTYTLPALPAGLWREESIPLTAFGSYNGILGFWLQDGSGGPQSAYSIDDIEFVEDPANAGPGAKLVEVRTVDESHVMIHWLDGEVEYDDDGVGPGAFTGHGSGGEEVVIDYRPGLDTSEATDAANYTITSTDDPGFAAGVQPATVFRRTKVNGTNRTWPEPAYTLEHIVYLRLPQPLENGASYTVSMDPDMDSDTETADFTFDIFQSVSEAVHVNIIGYEPARTVVKSADLYMWLGDGGARDYSSFEGADVFLYNVDTGQSTPVGDVDFWKARGDDLLYWDLTHSDVWNVDFSDFQGTGTYRLVVDRVGCSPEFEIQPNIYREPFKFSVRGFFYMRIGMAVDSNYPPPRQPQYLPGDDPSGFTVYRTTLWPGHPDWASIGGDVWDRKSEWAAYLEPGSPTNPNAWGGHSDALDWDRHAGHVSIIYDMLLPYLLSNGAIDNDDLDITESGNGIPDILDEARYEVDLWLRLRDGDGGYSWGLNNPSDDGTTMYQAAATPVMAWANAANCAMMADCFRIAGKPILANYYKNEAITAWNHADEQDLNYEFGVGNFTVTGRDLKMLAAASLYNVTGDTAWEDAVNATNRISGPTTEVDNNGDYSQLWALGVYLMTDKYNWRPINYPAMVDNMKAAIRHEATTKGVNKSNERPSRRSTDEAYWWFQSIQMVHALCIAHAVTEDGPQRDAFLKALVLEADYGLGRNPLNATQMTGLGSRHPVNIYTSGRDDGVPGLHPGHTPYMNADAWGPGFGADPQWYASKGYPAWDQWPHGEALWDVRYCYANNEFTPQQSMGGKMVLLGYLYFLGLPEGDSAFLMY